MSIAILKQLTKQKDKLEEKIYQEALKTFPPGTPVRFFKGKGIVSGIVSHNIPSISGGDSPRVKILSDSGKEYWLYLFWILDHGV